MEFSCSHSFVSRGAPPERARPSAIAPPSPSLLYERSIFVRADSRVGVSSTASAAQSRSCRLRSTPENESIGRALHASDPLAQLGVLDISSDAPFILSTADKEGLNFASARVKSASAATGCSTCGDSMSASCSSVAGATWDTIWICAPLSEFSRARWLLTRLRILWVATGSSQSIRECPENSELSGLVDGSSRTVSPFRFARRDMEVSSTPTSISWLIPESLGNSQSLDNSRKEPRSEISCESRSAVAAAAADGPVAP